ncbi:MULTISPECIES: GNAT family N-acetyltransferase [unclassified Pseudomonas]|uniref:GNAT family N-acetyltransferase n=1 Tax=unclassified Pseudomonas TaxID=196821 RepID=UPI000BCA9495|nr:MULTISPECIES: GNAT family protein [unclassified Pseudomonas]PVZ10486.1 RimJ/RimL family protein N-acetyltransferase [Pseudomonas sp. URIL14HWK12:I12]PVZ21912.1 RimJ/RimL family protein N-acetyltransferase [Pseudomonas sp. URIL14HWK12:I10]PVZ31005.1 RimJ/RimL family protein N-acetyltransferase [Pseudomonas sp. URIL14HWK12:I11]SNZ17528.1 Protein N-acetyltransferase, RimJ/RimL family [Pseudomonas sp. URIL14HWK12:I9]
MPDSLQWSPPKALVAQPLEGRFMRLEKLDPARHGDDLWTLLQGEDADPKLWDYLPYGPFADRERFDIWLDGYAVSPDPWGFCVVDKTTGQAQGIMSLMSIVPAHGRIEIGHVAFSSAMQRTPKGTEAIYRLARFAFEHGYRRVEWKCDNANERSRRAAQRSGFIFEGAFRQHMVVKGHNRDTAWFSMLDNEWPALERAFEAWLSDDNFEEGKQLRTLEDIRGR